MIHRVRSLSCAGFSLIETIVAISVFAVFMLGITPLVASSLRGAALSRSFNVGKTLAVQALERVRGLPYYDSAPNRDALDLYFPNMTASAPNGYAIIASGDPSGIPAGAGFITSCTSSSSLPANNGARACPPAHADGTSQVPPGYTVKFVAQFVQPSSGAATETYAVVTPSGYDTAVSASSTPPSNLLRIYVVVSWTYAGRSRSYQLSTLVGDRKLSPDKVRATGTTDFVVQALTSFQNGDGEKTSLTATVGQSRSEAQVRSFAAADYTGTAVAMTLAKEQVGSTPGSVLSAFYGGQIDLHAPPDTPSPAQVTTSGTTITNTDLVPALDVAGVEQSRADENYSIGPTAIGNTIPAPTVVTTAQLPRVSGNSNLNPGLSAESFWVNNQADTSNTAARQLLAGAHVLSVRQLGSTRLRGASYAEATSDSSASRKVESAAHARFGELRLLPTIFAPDGLIIIRNFTADIFCRTDGTAGTVGGKWTATVNFWRDAVVEGTVLGAGYSGDVVISGDMSDPSAPDLLRQQASPSSNPVVIDSLVQSERVYLFHDATRAGYLDGWSSTPFITFSSSADATRVSMSQAINITIARTDPTNPESKLVINIGKVSCEAVDKR